jgi:crossover junction endodeoxyribonuclease RuvC
VTPARPRILALDLSLTHTGVCSDGETSCISTAGLRGVVRLDHIVRQVQSLARGVDVVVLEGYSYGSRGRSVFDIGELGGGVRLLLHRLDIPFVEVPPSTLKKYATGQGNAGKDAMIAEAVRRFGFPGHSNDEADAWLLWCLARQAYGAPVARVPAAQLKALSKLEWPAFNGSRCA